MKTAANQSITVLFLIVLAFGATLGVSWGIIQIIYPSDKPDSVSVKSKLIKKVEQEVQRDFIRTFKYLIPKLK